MPGAGDRFPEMSEYDRKQWERLSAYWGKRANRRGHPNWLHDSGAFLARTAHDASHAVVEKVPDGLKDAATRATEAVTTKAAPVLDKAAAPALHELVHLLELRKENLEIIEMEIDPKCPCVGKAVDRLGLPPGSKLISVLRAGVAEIAMASTVLEVGDQVLAILEPEREDEVRKLLLGH